jgi:hypothetical protein
VRAVERGQGRLSTFADLVGALGLELRGRFLVVGPLGYLDILRHNRVEMARVEQPGSSQGSRLGRREPNPQEAISAFGFRPVTRFISAANAARAIASGGRGLAGAPRLRRTARA